MSSSEKRKPDSLAHGPTVHAIKRAKYEAKQERRRQALAQEQQGDSSAHPPWASWFKDREEYAAHITEEDVCEIRRLRAEHDNKTHNKIERLKRIADWIEPFFDLKEMPNVSNGKDKDQRLFIAEGTEVVRMMVQRCREHNDTSSPESPPPIQLISILSKPATFFDSPIHLLGDIEKRNFIDDKSIMPPFKIVVASEEALSKIAGFRIARGAMACGVIPTYMKTNGYAWLKRLLSRETKLPATINNTTQQQHKTIKRLLALDAISNTANMGSILRTAAAFSVDAIILSDDSCDAFYRQCVRTSMGHVISVPILRVADWKYGLENDAGGIDYHQKVTGLAGFLRWLREHMGVECFAAVVDDDSEKYPSQPLITLGGDKECGSRSWCCVLGNEGHGIRDEVIQECNKRLRIGMATGVDSLSLPIAAGILMHGLSSSSTVAES